jgi:hypothetical protein
MAAQQQRVKVRVIVESVAGLGDPTAAQLEEKYKRLQQDLVRSPTPISPMEIEKRIQAARDGDAGAIKTGFTSSFCLKAGDVRALPIDLARAWENAGMIEIIRDEKGNAVA